MPSRVGQGKVEEYSEWVSICKQSVKVSVKHNMLERHILLHMYIHFNTTGLTTESSNSSTLLIKPFFFLPEHTTKFYATLSPVPLKGFQLPLAQKLELTATGNKGCHTEKIISSIIQLTIIQLDYQKRMGKDN